MPELGCFVRINEVEPWAVCEYWWIAGRNFGLCLRRLPVLRTFLTTEVAGCNVPYVTAAEILWSLPLLEAYLTVGIVVCDSSYGTAIGVVRTSYLTVGVAVRDAIWVSPRKEYLTVGGVIWDALYVLEPLGKG